ncbi:hypothetical protein E1301_Tti001026 [Triplophysa tibetana]|uniref:Uncharacterized protein n=1 Tax=Triplophysa tibetana TaxID=1572043 RepID=A0A5A9N6P0_9TELE|nr:hypothetical protein E1301_Tti001026 [Triplophysa tibetana]
MAHEISVLAISHEVISQFDLCRRQFDFKVFGGNRNHTPVRKMTPNTPLFKTQLHACNQLGRQEEKRRDEEWIIDQAKRWLASLGRADGSEIHSGCQRLTPRSDEHRQPVCSLAGCCLNAALRFHGLVFLPLIPKICNFYCMWGSDPVILLHIKQPVCLGKKQGKQGRGHVAVNTSPLSPVTSAADGAARALVCAFVSAAAVRCARDVTRSLDAFVELYSQPRDSAFHPFSHLTKVLGLAALGLAGMTIGAFFTQKTNNAQRIEQRNADKWSLRCHFGTGRNVDIDLPFECKDWNSGSLTS